MHDSTTVFFLESGNLALDLLNTGVATDRGSAEHLPGPRELVAWIEAAGLSRHDLADPTAARILLTEARRLRDDVAGLVAAIGREEPVPSHIVFALNRVLGASRTCVSVEVDHEGPRVVPRERGETPLTTLAPVARAAAELLVSAEPSRVRQCSSDTCDRWFLDTSKGGRRKWCSMATCGNRAKAESHRKRHAAA